MAQPNRGAVIQGSFPHGVPRWLSASATDARLRSLPVSTRGGQPLPPQVRQAMEAMFGASFAAVRVHVNAHPTTIGAVAFTRGTDIHFAPGHYDPATVQGRRVLARELTHVVQQRAGRVHNPHGGVAVISDRALEAEAERMSQRAAALRIAPEHAPLQRKVLQMFPKALTMAETQKYLDDTIDAYCAAHGAAAPFPAAILKERDSPEYKALELRLHGDPKDADRGWISEGAVKIYAKTIVAEYAVAPRRLTEAYVYRVLDDEIDASVRRNHVYLNLIKELSHHGVVGYRELVEALRGTAGAHKLWKSLGDAHAKLPAMVDKYVREESQRHWPRTLTADDATIIVHTLVKRELKERDDRKEGYPAREAARVAGRTGEALKEFQQLVTFLRGEKNDEVWLSRDAAALYLWNSGHVEAFITKVLRIPNVPLGQRTTLDGTTYAQRNLLCDAIRLKHATVDDVNLNTVVGRMDNNRSVSGNGDLTKLHAAGASKADIGRLQAGTHASFGRGPGGCTLFFRNSAAGNEILAIGYHVMNSENYEIVWAFSASLRGRWSF